MSVKALVKKTGETALISFDGTVDYETTEPLKKNIKKLVEKGDVKRIVFDMKDLNLIGSQGIGPFVNTMKELNEVVEVAPKYCNMKSEWKKLFQAFAESEETFDIYDSEEKAIKSFDN